MSAPYRAADPLGLLVSSHPASGTQQKLRVGLVIFCLIVAVDAVALPFLGPAGASAVDWRGMIPLGVIGLIFASIAVTTSGEYLQARRQRADVYERGLRLHDGPRTRELRWSDVISVGGRVWAASGRVPRQDTALWLEVSTGERLPLPSPARDPYALGWEIRRRTFEARLARAKARLAAGEMLPFGQCALGTGAMAVHRETFERSKIAKVALSSRWLEVRLTRGATRIVPTDQVPDVDVLLALLGG